MSYIFTPIKPLTLQISLLPPNPQQEAAAKDRLQSSLVKQDACLKKMLQQLLQVLDDVSEEEGLQIILNHSKNSSTIESEENEKEEEEHNGMERPYCPQAVSAAIRFITQLAPPLSQHDNNSPEGIEKEKEPLNFLEEACAVYHRAYGEQTNHFRESDQFGKGTEFLYPCHLYYYLQRQLLRAADAYLQKEAKLLAEFFSKQNNKKGDESARCAFFVIQDFYGRFQKVINELTLLWSRYNHWLSTTFQRIIAYHQEHTEENKSEDDYAHYFSLQKLGKACLTLVLEKYPSLVDAATTGALSLLEEDLQAHNEPTTTLLQQVLRPSYYPPALLELDRQACQDDTFMRPVGYCYVVEDRYPFIPFETQEQ
ncbi:hypothetical protein ADEAN_000477300 [Angomonas deanei]|uniref:Uncharacterized protein n=1 Tax=Angomonas deanei TaxID=59799 RepID=A0A7G2CCX7_9TRYP|nr:hypothetical protein ADEAN_000477300 [Angomonas deanei]